MALCMSKVADLNRDQEEQCAYGANINNWYFALCGLLGRELGPHQRWKVNKPPTDNKREPPTPTLTSYQHSNYFGPLFDTTLALL